jgi:hypothetical protein
MNETKIRAYMNAAMGTLSQSGARVADAMDRIETSAGSASVALPLQLLAARKYLRNGDASVAANWAWTEAEQASKKTQEPAKTLYAEAEKARAAFGCGQPGIHAQSLAAAQPAGPGRPVVPEHAGEERCDRVDQQDG